MSPPPNRTAGRRRHRRAGDRVGRRRLVAPRAAGPDHRPRRSRPDPADPQTQRRPSRLERRPLRVHARVLETDTGRTLYGRRQGMIEPVFANTKFNRRVDRFLRRGRAACRSEWRLITATTPPQARHRYPRRLNAARRRRPHDAARQSARRARFTQQPPRKAAVSRSGRQRRQARPTLCASAANNSRRSRSRPSQKMIAPKSASFHGGATPRAIQFRPLSRVLCGTFDRCCC